MIGNLRCCNNIHWGKKDLCHCSMNVSWLHDTVPSKIKSNLNCRCQLTCDDWGIPNTKLKYYQCTSAALLCCKNRQLFNCIWQIITHDWWIWTVLFIPRSMLSNKFLIWGLILCISDFGRGQCLHREFGLHRKSKRQLNYGVKLICVTAEWTVSCKNDNLQCNQWRRVQQIDIIYVSMMGLTHWFPLEIWKKF